MVIKRRKTAQSSAKCVSEEDVGITQFVSSHLKGFEGLIKQRYSDFQVNEIDLNGEVVTLKALDAPVQEQTKSEPQEITRIESDALQPNEETAALAKIIGDDLVDQCFKLISGELETKLISTEPIGDKSMRTEIHRLIREGFFSKLDSKTDDGRIAITKVEKRSKGGRSEYRRAAKQAEYLHFTLYKENKDTLEALSYIAKMLRIPAKSMTFAGTKDRRAVTTQRICWRKGNANRLCNLNAAFRGNIQLGDFKFESHTIKLGDLCGNRFEIVIREVDSSDLDEIEKSLTSLRDHGFINYFGLQRFGTFSVWTHTIGKHILCRDYEKAVEGILNPQDVTLEDSREAREIWANEGNAAKALELMPRRCVAECSMLGALIDSPNPLNALLRIPHSLKTMYVHAYQSYIWNRAASERISRNPHHAIQGDLVLESEEKTGIQRAREVTEEEVKTDAISIFDVVLPSPGNDILYPSNMVSFYEKIMEEDNINCHNMRHKIKEFSVFGAYRKVLAKPLDLTWFVRRYTSNEDTIVYTDREVLETGIKLAPEPQEEDASKIRLAIVLQLSLSTSQYATMALREAMKQETSRNGKIYFG